MPKIRIGTFNVENLFARYKFKSNIDPEKAVLDGWKADQRRFSIYDEKSKKITAKAIKALNAHILAFQEVENLDTLKRFRNDYLGGRKAYPYVVAIDGNDPRLIDVAVMSKYPLIDIQTYQHLWVPSWKYYLFSRDCLEVDVQLPGNKIITLYVNHFKSMMGGRAKTRFKRKKQAKTVKEIIINRFGPNAGDHPFIVLGDFNDYLEEDSQGKTGIDDLVLWDQVENVVDRLPQDERWTHYYKRKRLYRQLDYILLSKSLADTNANPPYIERRGLPKRADKYSGPRFPNVGKNKPKASDHCPLVMELSI